MTGDVGLARGIFAWRQSEVGAECGRALESCIAVLKASAVTAPTPGTVIRRRHTWSCLATASTALCSNASWLMTAARVVSIVPTTHRICASPRRSAPRPELELAGRDLADLEPERLEHATDVIVEVDPHPHQNLAAGQEQPQLPRLGRFRCTGRYQPTCIADAMLRASIRSVLTGIALTAAFMCRASMQITGRPAAARPSHSQGANGPASMPTRSKISPVAIRNAAMASGPARAFAFAHDPARIIDDADRRLFHSDVETDIMLHGCPPYAADARLGRISDPVLASLSAQAACPSRRSEPAARLRHLRPVFNDLRTTRTVVDID